MPAYYNEHDKFAAAWLRALIKDGHIAPGDVDERDIQDVSPDDLRPYTQVHLFAGIGGWSYALRLAGWPDDRPVWTGSCPCQPFSSAGKRRGTADKRHLWPDMFRIVRECKPDVVFGEQVASSAGYEWVAGVHTDMDAEGYGFGAIVLGAHSVGAPHIRQRLWWVADAQNDGLARCRRARSGRGGSADGGGLGNSAGDGRDTWGPQSSRPMRTPCPGGPGNSDHQGREGRQLCERGRSHERASWSSGNWDGTVTIPCGDGKTRRIEPSISPLVDGIPGRVGLLRGYGNAIVPQVAAEFVRACWEARSA